MEYSYKPTTHGRSVLAAYMALGTKPFKITRVAFGSGKVGEDVNLADVHELLEYVIDGTVAERAHKDERLFLTIQYANSAHKDTPTFLLSEFIIYVEDPETGGETDLIYGTLGDYRQPVPAYNPAYPPSVFNFPLELILSDEIQVSISAPAGLVTWDDLQKAVTMLAVRHMDVTIPMEGWERTEEGRYPFCLDIPVAIATEDMMPMLIIWPEYMEAVGACGMSPFVRTVQGGIRMYAEAAPAGELQGTLTLFGSSGLGEIPGEGGGAYALPVASATRLGGVRVKEGSGLVVDDGGNLSIDAATAQEVADVFNGSAVENNQ